MSKIRLIILFSVVAGCLASCNRTGKNQNSVPEYDLESTSIAEIDSETISMPGDLILNGNRLIVSNITKSEDALNVFDLNGNLLQSGIKYGQGPQEILDIASLHFTDGVLHLYDQNKGVIYKVDTVGELKITPAVEGVIFQNDAISIPPYVLKAAIAFNNNISYYLTMGNGEICDSLSYFPPAPENVDPATHALACTGYLAINKEGNVFMRAIVYDGSVDFFSIKDGKLKHINRYEIFPMEYSAKALPNGRSVPVPSDDSRSGFVYTAASDNYFYASFSNEKALDNPYGAANKIYKFDLEGTPVAIYNLDKSIRTFDVMPDDSKIYALAFDKETDESRIVSFQITK